MNCARLRDRIVLITGSTSGIELGLARVFTREGENLVLHGPGVPQEMQGSRDKIAALALCLCTEHARSITGATILIDGGWTAR